MAVPTPETPNLSVSSKLTATVLLLRDTHCELEVCVQEHVFSMHFTANMTVFPGGGVDRCDFPAVANEGLTVTEPSGVDPESRIAQTFNIDPTRTHALTCVAVRGIFEKAGALLVRDASGEIVADGHRFHRQRRQLEVRELPLTDSLSDENLTLDAGLVSPRANWVTPESSPIRYGAHFFLVALPDGQKVDGDTSETSSSGWFYPTTILDGWRRGLPGLMPLT